MKSVYLLLSAFLLLAAAPALAQQDDLNRFIDDHKTDQDFLFAYLSKDLFEVASRSEIADKDWQKLHQVVRNVGSLRILAADKIANGLDLFKEVRGLVPAEMFDELLTLRSGQDNVRIWTKEEDGMVSDLILLVGTPDAFVLICFAGDLELAGIADLAALFNAAEAGKLVQAAKAVSIDFKLSPNPSASGIITLDYADDQDPPVLLSVADQNGRPVTTRELSALGTQQVHLQELPAGLYWVQLKTKQGKIGVKQLQIVQP